jgi:hypothetical protein
MPEQVDGANASHGYRFEPLAKNGLLLGLGGGQLGLVAASVLAAFLVLKDVPGAGGFAAAAGVVLSAGAACRPVNGRSGLQWAGLASSFVARTKKQVSSPIGHIPGASALRLPAKTFASHAYLSELAATGPDGPLGLVLDEASGTAAALMRARGGQFCLLDGPGKERRLAAWAAVLESVANQRSSLVRLQWCQRALPGDPTPLLEHLRVAGDPESASFAGHGDLLEGAGARSWRHETLLVVSVRSPLSRRHFRLPEEVAAELRNEVGSIRAQLHSAGIACDGPLDAGSTAAALGASLVARLDRHPRSHPWPLAVEEHWGEVRVEGWWHRTYWVAEWPRSRVGPDFLSPLLVGRGRRSFSVVMAPVPPDRAARDAESSRTAQLADAQLRAQGGFLETARHRRQAEAVEGREEELADGRGAFQLAGYVSVSAESKEELRRSCAELERSAGAARLCLRALYGQQREALIWALPFGRGL